MKDKSQYVFLAVIGMAISSLAFADSSTNSNKKDYKCYLDTTSGCQIVIL